MMIGIANNFKHFGCVISMCFNELKQGTIRGRGFQATVRGPRLWAAGVSSPYLPCVRPINQYQI